MTFFAVILCFFSHHWSKWMPDMDAKWDYRYCLRCGRRENRKVV